MVAFVLHWQSWIVGPQILNSLLYGLFQKKFADPWLRPSPLPWAGWPGAPGLIQSSFLHLTLAVIWAHRASRLQMPPLYQNSQIHISRPDLSPELQIHMSNCRTDTWDVIAISSLIHPKPNSNLPSQTCFTHSVFDFSKGQSHSSSWTNKNQPIKDSGITVIPLSLPMQSISKSSAASMYSETCHSSSLLLLLLCSPGFLQEPLNWSPGFYSCPFHLFAWQQSEWSL